MQVASLFEQDNYALRHQTGHNMLDPESVITGAEIARGFTYDNSHRDYLTEQSYKLARSGEVPLYKILIFAPRVLNYLIWVDAISEWWL
jgi:hypothetical protein